MTDTPPDPLASSENIVSLSRFRARHVRDIRQKSLEALLDAKNPEQAIRSLPGERLYEILRGGDPSEHLDVLVHARVEQLQTVFDLALWSGDRLSPARLDRWIGCLAMMPSEVVTRWLTGLDVELVALLLRKGARIYDLETEFPPDEPEGAFYPTPDGFFVLDVTGYRPESDDASPSDETAAAADGPAEDAATPTSADALIRIVDNLYRGNLNFARRILVGAKSELDSELEETAYRWRQGRLQDLGFEDARTAREIYRELDPATVRIGELRPGTRVRPVGLDESPADSSLVPAALAVELEGDSLFARAFARITSAAEVEELNAALYALTNRVLAAAGVEAGDEDAVAENLARLRGTLDLGVDYLARRAGVFDEDRAVDAVRTVALGRLFRVGVSLMSKVRMLATTLRRRAPFAGAGGLDLVEDPEATALETARRPHPAFPRLLDDPPASGDRPIASLADLARLTAAIERAAAAELLLLGLGVTPGALEAALREGTEPADKAALDTGILARTAVISALLERAQPTAGAAPSEGRVAFRALTPLEVGRFKKRLAGASAATRARARAILDRPVPAAMQRAAREMIDRWVASLEPLEQVLVRPARRTPRPPRRPTPR